MKKSGIKATRQRSIKFASLFCILTSVFCLLFFSGCGGGSGGGGTTVVSSATGVSDGETGGLAVQLVWPTPNGKFAAPAGVATVRISISASDMATVTRDFTASANAGTLTAILAGSSRIVSAKGLDSLGGCLYSGSTSGVTVTAGQTTSVTITLSTLCGNASKIVFDSNRDGNRGIYSMNADGTGVTRLTNDPQQDLDAHFSPDGSKIVWAKCAFCGEVYIMNSDGTGATNLTNNPDNEYYPVFSHNGTKIAFCRNGGEVDIMNVDGTNVHRVSGGCHSAFSPDDTKIVHDGGGIYIVNVDGTNDHLINPTGDDPTFSPDGSKIAYSVNNAEVYIMNADGSNTVNLTNNGNGIQDYFPEFSRDGSKIVFTSNRDGNFEIYIMNVDGTNPINLTNNPAQDVGPSF